MSLIRQMWLLLLCTLLLGIVGGVGVNVLVTRGALQAQLQLRNADSAALLAVALATQHGDRALGERLLAAEFDGGSYRKIRFDAADDVEPFVRASEHAAREAPGWFVRWAAIEPAPGMAQVSDGWRPLGTLEVARSVASAHDELWRDSLRAAQALAALGAVVGLLGALAISRIRRLLATAVGQADALVEGRFATVVEPSERELRSLTRAMNTMVTRLKQSLELQAAHVEQLRLQAHCDALTGLSNRSHFLSQLEAALQREDGPELCGLVLLRLGDLAGLNRTLGRPATDRILCAIGDTLRPYSERVPGCFLGRLNGADFALCLPVGGVAQETAQALATGLQAVLPGFGRAVAVSLGAVELRRDTPLAQALSNADEALARAESRGTYAVELGGESASVRPGLGEEAWRQGIPDALQHGRAKLAGFALLDAAGALVHLECPLQLQLRAGDEFEAAARWLPLAVRARATVAVDTRAVALALDAVDLDDQPRCVNLAPASLVDGAFVGQLRALLLAAPRAAGKLSLDVAEAAAVDRFDLLQELVRQLRPFGVRVGLEHAGSHLGQIERLFELGLDFVKLDATVTRDVASDPQRITFVRGSVDLLHGLSLRVYAEGVSDDADARSLWACGVDGITGPWASARHASKGYGAG